jgi:hypothetical protein
MGKTDGFDAISSRVDAESLRRARATPAGSHAWMGIADEAGQLADSSARRRRFSGQENVSAKSSGRESGFTVIRYRTGCTPPPSMGGRESGIRRVRCENGIILGHSISSGVRPVFVP